MRAEMEFPEADNCQLCGKLFKGPSQVLTHLAAFHSVVEKFMSSDYHIAKKERPSPKDRKLAAKVRLADLHHGTEQTGDSSATLSPSSPIPGKKLVQSTGFPKNYNFARLTLFHNKVP